MRDEREVVEKFDELYARYLSKRQEEFLSRNFRNCLHNVRLRVKGNGKCGFCCNPKILQKTSGSPFVCDEEGTAGSCSFYKCRNTPESIRDDFNSILKVPAQCGNEFPKLGMLIWFLQSDKPHSRYGRFCSALRGLVGKVTHLLLWRWW
jgi:hypothetical protein